MKQPPKKDFNAFLSEMEGKPGSSEMKKSIDDAARAGSGNGGRYNIRDVDAALNVEAKNGRGRK